MTAPPEPDKRRTPSDESEGGSQIASLAGARITSNASTSATEQLQVCPMICAGREHCVFACPREVTA